MHNILQNCHAFPVMFLSFKQSCKFVEIFFLAKPQKESRPEAIAVRKIWEVLKVFEAKYSRMELKIYWSHPAPSLVATSWSLEASVDCRRFTLLEQILILLHMFTLSLCLLINTCFVNICILYIDFKLNFVLLQWIIYKDI